MDEIAFKGKSQIRKDLLHGILFNVGTKKSINLLRFKKEGGFTKRLGNYVYNSGNYFAGIEQLNQLAGTLDSFDSVFCIQPFLKAGRGIGTHTERSGCAAHRGAVETGTLKEDHSCISDDFRVLTAHNTCNCDRLFRITDAKHIRSKSSFRTVQRADCFTRLCAADTDFPAVNTGKVKCVHRLAVFQHNIVGDIHDIVDRTHTGIPDTLRHPGRRRRNADIPDHACGITRAEVSVLNDDLCQISNIAFCFSPDSRFMQFQLFPERDSCFSGQTNHAQAVRAVGCNLEINNVIVQAHFDRHVISRLIVALEDQNTVFNGIWKIMCCGTQFLIGAKHAIGFHPAEGLRFDLNSAGKERIVQGNRNEISLLHILGTGADLNSSALPHIHLADPHMVGIRVADYLSHSADKDIPHRQAEILGGFHLGAGNRHCLGKGTVTHFTDRQINKFIKPFSG